MSDDRWVGACADADAERIEFEPWIAAYADEPAPEHAERVAELDRRPGYALHPRSFVARSAHVVAERLVLGEHSTIAGDCVIRGDVTVGAHTSLNSGVRTIGRVAIGDLVRIATGTVLVGENHGFEDLDVPIAAQPLTTVGVVVEDDVWIGANVTIVDGVTVGAHSIVAAGAVVTHDVAPWTIVGGVPARPIRDRRDGSRRRRHRRDPLAEFDRRVADQWPDALDRCRTRVDGIDTYVDVPEAAAEPRPLNDAVEIAAAFGAVPPGFSAGDLIERIQSQQDPTTGVFVDPGLGSPVDPLEPSDREWDMYGYLSCGYALEVLGSAPLYPAHAVEQCSADRLRRILDGLDFGYLAWPSGSWIDGFATAALLNRRHHGSERTHRTLWTWLEEHCHPSSGMWGTYLDPTGEWDFRWLMAVNGYYRLIRGTYAASGVPLPYPEAAIDTVLAHSRDYGAFAERERNACNVLDLVHPLWALGRQTERGYRDAEIRDVAADVLASAVGDWVDGAGVPWDVNVDQPGLQGTEMWLSIVYLAADVLGESAGLSWEPRGVHRLHG